MKYAVFSIMMILLCTLIHDIIPYDIELLEEVEEISPFNLSHTIEFQSNSPESKNDNIHFLFQMHKAINTIHDNYLNMLRSEKSIREQYGQKPDISYRCIKGLQEFSLGLKEKRLWALMMVDSRGNIPSGILEGNFYSTGDFDQCIDSEVPEKFQGQYCEVGVNQNIHFQYQSSDPLEPMDLSYVHETNQSKIWDSNDKFPNGLFPVTTSLCFPSACSFQDVKYFISKVSKPFEEILKIDVSKCLVKSQHQYTNGEKFGMILIIFIIVLEIIATAVDIHFNTSQGKNINGTNVLKKTLLCLSLRINFTKFCQQDSHPDIVKIFNGLKVFAMFLTIYHHDLFYKLLEFAKLKQVYKLMASFPFTLAWTSPIAVDIFFFISGFLVLYSSIKSRNSSLNIVPYVLKRYLRLWIPALFVFGCSFFFLNSSHGPMWSNRVEQIVFGNRFNWWQNALCIHNFFPLPELFLNWTWYLAVDMQLSIFAFFILLIYRKSPTIAMHLVKIIIVVALIFLAFKQYYHGFHPIMCTVNTKISAFPYVMATQHYPTYYHIAPFCVGILTCHAISTTKDEKISKGIKLAGWSLSIILSFVCWFLPYIWNHRAATIIESVMFGSLHRFMWSLVLAWLTYLHFKKEKGILVSLLSWKGFTYLGSLNFMAYLIQSPLIRIQSGLARDRLPLSFSSHIASVLVNAVVTYILALIVHLVCEAPLSNLINLLFAFLQGKKEVKKNQ